MSGHKNGCDNMEQKQINILKASLSNVFSFQSVFQKLIQLLSLVFLITS